LKRGTVCAIRSQIRSARDSTPSSAIDIRVSKAIKAAAITNPMQTVPVRIISNAHSVIGYSKPLLLE
jgi:hypothetical protein